MAYKSMIAGLVVLAAVFCGEKSAWAILVVHSQVAVAIELIGYDGLVSSALFKGELAADSEREITTPYRGLAYLVFAGGQRYPVIIGDETFALKIASPDEPPAFTESVENNFFHQEISGDGQVVGKHDFALLLLQAKELLESSNSIKTVNDLKAKKQEFQNFVRNNYEWLRYSDMVRRLIAQYFMMHEYVDYGVEGAPATDIRGKYQNEVISGVGIWLDLQPNISKEEMLNYCVSLYYTRSMVTLASLIIDQYRAVAVCSGGVGAVPDFPADMSLVDADGGRERKLSGVNGNMIIAFVSDDCAVSLVETVVKARQLASRKDWSQIIVAPLQELSTKHLSMAKMISSGSLLFVNDEKWRKANLTEKINLPLFVQLRNEAVVKE